VGEKAAPVFTPTPTLPQRGGEERGPWGRASSVALQALAEMWESLAQRERGNRRAVRIACGSCATSGSAQTTLDGRA
jgi:hypothetical protein